MSLETKTPTVVAVGGITKISFTANYNSGMATHKLSVDDLPIELVSGNHWLNWKDFAGRKSPLDAQEYRKGYNDSSTWVPLDTAINRARGDNKLHVGLTLKQDGLQIGDGWLWCLDFDGFLDGGDADDGVNEFLDELGTYVEISPSKTGLKAFFTTDKAPVGKSKVKFGPSRFAAKHPSVSKYKNREIEVFSRGSFQSVTGDRFGDKTKPLRHILGAEVDTLLNKLHKWAVSTGGSGRDSNPKTTQQPSAHSSTTYTKLSIEQLDLALLHIEAETENTWFKVVNVLARVYGEDARESWHVYSKQSVKYNFEECDERYNRALRELQSRPNGYGIRHLIELASKHPDWHKVSQQFEYWGEIPTSGSLWESGPLQLELPIKDELVDSVNNDYLWDAHGLQIYSLKTRMYARKDGFISNYQNQRVQTGKNRSVGLGTYWMESPQRRCVNGLVLSPSEGEITSTGAFNTWRGYSCDPVEGDISPFMEVFNHLLSDENDRAYVLKWLARLIQNPETPFKVALAIHGRTQGTGKNTIFEAIGELFHSQHWGVIGNAQMVGQFNDWQLDKVFVIGDEVSNTSSRSEADLMKRYITATENNINPKGMPAMRQKNLIKYVLLSNRDEIVHIEGGDRRYYVVETTDNQLPQVMADRFYTWKTGGGLSHILFHLLSFNVAGFDPTAPAPMTAAKAGVIEAGKSGLDLWVEEEASELIAKGKLLASTAELVSRYQISSRNSTSDKAMSNALQRAGGMKLPKQAILQSGRRIRLYSLGDHERFKVMPDSELGKQFEDMHLHRGCNS